MNEELDSQLSAMFDDELPAEECELLARRLSRDDELKARWSRYAAIGATIRAEGGARLNVNLARRVNTAISAEAANAGLTAAGPRPASRWWLPLSGVAVAASVAAVSILWLRSQAPVQQPPLARIADNHPSGSISYVVPKATPRRVTVPSTQLANYVVAHSEFSSPVTRRNLLSAFMANESAGAGNANVPEEPVEDVTDDAKSAQ